MGQTPGSNSKPFNSDTSNTWGNNAPPSRPAEGWTPGEWPKGLQWIITTAREQADLARKIYPERYVRMPNGKMELYFGPGLVDEYGNLVRENQYDVSSDSKRYYGDKNPAQRNSLMQDLVKGGFLDKGSIGDYGSEMVALQKAFDFANINYSTIDKAIKDRIAGMPIGWDGGGGKAVRTYRTTSPEDLTKIANKVAQDTIGRELTAAEAAQFTSAYQQQEIQFQKSYYGGGTVTEAPSPDVAAETFAQQAAPTEAAGYKFLGYANKLFQMIGVG